MPLSLKTIAERAGCSTATVSRALRGSPLVHGETRAAVQEAATALGYVRPALVGEVMSSLRRSDQHSYLGNLAIIHIRSPGPPSLLPFQKEFLVGVRRRAADLGFALNELSHIPGQSRLPALQRVLRARGVTGLIFFNILAQADLSAFDWSPYAAVQIDYPVLTPTLHTAGIDHHGTLHLALTELLNRGYRRIGLFMTRPKDQRLVFKWSGAFTAFQRRHPDIDPIPELEQPAISRRQFLQWFKRHRPDVVVGHQTEVIDWLREAGVRVPDAVGFVTLNHNEASRPCAGLDLVPAAQGAVAVDAVVGQIHRFERGIPERPTMTLIEGNWVEGPTVRPPPGRPAR
jgi:LacI family transcriptional regulator